MNESTHNVKKFQMQFPGVLGSNKYVTPQELLLIKINKNTNNCYSMILWAKT